MVRCTPFNVFFSLLFSLGGLIIFDFNPFSNNLHPTSVSSGSSVVVPPAIMYVNRSWFNENLVPGSKLLDFGLQHWLNNPSSGRQYRYLIHQSWKSEDIPEKFHAHVHSWSQRHPDALHVLWTDEDNKRLVEKFYPEFAATFQSFAMAVQRCDLVRLLYLHRFGGLYADLDYEARGHIWQYLANKNPTGSLTETADIFIVESGVLFNEVMQNSLMLAASGPGHPFWYDVASNIDHIWGFLTNPNPEVCRMYGWRGCDQTWYFRDMMFQDVASLLYTQHITGSAVLDKTYVQSVFKNKHYRVAILSTEEFLFGSVAKHSHFNTWVNIPYAIRYFIFLIASGFLILFLFGFFLARYRFVAPKSARSTDV